MTPGELALANLHRVFGERDADARRAAAAELLAADVRFQDPEETVVGPDAVELKAAALLDAAPAGFVLAEDGPVYLDGDTAAIAWTFGPADGAPVARGIDIVTARDGRIAQLRTLLAG
jgi:ketosteroid isomerase-like protein